jgi:hypothetical protein
MKNKALMSLVLLAFVTASTAFTPRVFAQSPTLDKLAFTARTSAGKSYNEVKAANNNISGVVVIPETHNNIPVTTIPSSAFQNCTITSVTIPANVEKIGQSAFRGCANLTSVTFGRSDTDMTSAGLNLSFPGDLAIVYKANGAGTYTRPANGNWTKQSGAVVTAPAQTAPAQTTQQPANTAPGQATMDKLSFSNSGGGSRVNAANKTISGAVVIPDTYNNRFVNEIYNFSGCQAITSVAIPSSVITISSSAFSGCVALTSITIPASVTSIGGSAFANCNALTSVTFQGSAKTSNNSFPGDLSAKYQAGGAGTYTRPAGGTNWTKR